MMIGFFLMITASCVISVSVCTRTRENHFTIRHAEVDFRFDCHIDPLTYRLTRIDSLKLKYRKGVKFSMNEKENTINLHLFYVREICEMNNITLRGSVLISLFKDMADNLNMKIKLDDQSDRKFSSLMRTGKTWYEQQGFQYLNSDIAFRNLGREKINLAKLSEVLSTKVLPVNKEENQSLKNVVRFLGIWNKRTHIKAMNLAIMLEWFQKSKITRFQFHSIAQTKQFQWLTEEKCFDPRWMVYYPNDEQ